MTRVSAPTEPPGSLATQTAAGVVWMGAQMIISRFTSLAAQLALAYLLMPEHFGQVALVYTITAFSNQLTNPGIDEVLLQKQDRLRRWLSPAFWMALTSGICAAIMMVVTGSIVVQIARHYGNEAYGNANFLWMTMIVASAAPLNALSLVPTVLLRADLRFAKYAAMSLGEILLIQGLSVVCAAIGFGPYSFVAPMPVVAIIKGVVLWAWLHPTIRPHLGVHRWPSMIASTGWVFGQRLLNALVTQADRIALGVITANEVMVGHYFFTFLLSTQVTRLFGENVASVLLPTLNAMGDNRERIEGATERACRALAAIMIPISILQVLLAGPAIRLLFAAKWEPAIPLFQWLSFGPMLYAAVAPLTAMLSATGRFRAGFMVRVFNVGWFFALVIPLTWLWQAVGTSIAVSIWSWIAALSMAAVAYQSARGITLLLGTVMRPLLAGAAGAIPAALLMWYIPAGGLYDLATIAALTPLILALYLLVLHAIDPQATTELRYYASGLLQSLTRRDAQRPSTA
jgi:O-antigen/teichoic acid export membrane protein